MTTSLRNVLATTAVVVLATALAGCASAVPAAPSSPSASTDPEASDPAVAAVADYLEAVTFGNIAGAWRALSPESQATYDDSADTYARLAPTNGSVTAACARALAHGDFTVSAGPGDAFQLVSARAGDLADAWVVRDAGTGLRIDDAGAPPTGEPAYSWKNPDDTAHDPAVPPSIYFPTTHGAGGDADVIAGPPQAVVGYADGTRVTVTREASAGSGAVFTVDAPADTEVLTVVWAPDPERTHWQSTTVTLD